MWRGYDFVDFERNGELKALIRTHRRIAHNSCYHRVLPMTHQVNAVYTIKDILIQDGVTVIF